MSNTPGAVLWIILSKNVIQTDAGIKSWIEDRVRRWVEILKKGVGPGLQMNFSVLPEDVVLFDKHVRTRIRSAIIDAFGASEIGFENPSCLLAGTHSKHEESTGCDLKSAERCHRVHRLLLLDQSGRAFPCYGYWFASQRQDHRYPLLDEAVLISAYAARGENRFRSLCAECEYALSEAEIEVFPCARHGCSSHQTLWYGEIFQHLQFGGGERTSRCGNFVPVFETSLEQSRLRLEKILFKDNFWRSALIDKNYELERYWPVPEGNAGAVIPIYGSYRIELDSACSLDKYPASNYFAQEPVELPADTFCRIRDAFLPVCFLPHLRVMFDLAKGVCLLSVVLSDRQRGSEFRYRSLFRNDESAPACFVDTIWQSVWRLPYDWSAWKKNVLNFSSAIRLEHTQPAEYLAILSTVHFGWRRMAKVCIDLASVCIQFKTLIDHRASQFRKAMANRNETADGYDSALFPLLLRACDPTDNQCGRRFWETVNQAPWSRYLYVDDPKGQWIPWSSVREAEKADSGCRLLNYVIWVESVFQGAVGAIEAFNSTSISDKSPSQFVVFSAQPLGALERVRFKLTLTTLLQPIESAYAIGTEIDKHQLRLASTVYAAGHSQKNIFNQMGAPLETLASTDLIGGNPHLKSVVDELRMFMSWATSSSSNMDLIASLFLHQGQLDHLDDVFYAPTGTLYFPGKNVREFLRSIGAAGHLINFNENGLKILDEMCLVENIPTLSGIRRLRDSFYNELFQEICFNAKRWSNGQVEITRCPASAVLQEAGIVGRSDPKEHALLFSNPATESAFRGRGLSSRFISWLLHAQKGGLCYAAMRLEATKQGHVLVRRDEKHGRPYFTLAVILHNCQMLNDA